MKTDGAHPLHLLPRRVGWMVGVAVALDQATVGTLPLSVPVSAGLHRLRVMTRGHHARDDSLNK
ncbi:MAG: hypothetical protein EXR79_05190 [Myxococcales bacterium]|nr:hypothetical protein [Myxococcales bacterium]